MSRQLAALYMAIMSFSWLIAMILNDRVAWVIFKIITGVIVFLILRQMWRAAY